LNRCFNRLLFVCGFHRSRVFATARGAVAFGAMQPRLQRRFHVGCFATPNFQSRLLDGAGKKSAGANGELGRLNPSNLRRVIENAPADC
jgi:hypothetical protein